MVCDRTFIFHVCIPGGKTLFFAPRSRSSVKVRYQISRSRSNRKVTFLKKDGCHWGVRFHKHRLVRDGKVTKSGCCKVINQNMLQGRGQCRSRSKIRLSYSVQSDLDPHC